MRCQPIWQLNFSSSWIRSFLACDSYGWILVYEGFRGLLSLMGCFAGGCYAWCQDDWFCSFASFSSSMQTIFLSDWADGWLMDVLLLPGKPILIGFILITYSWVTCKLSGIPPSGVCWGWEILLQLFCKMRQLDNFSPSMVQPLLPHDWSGRILFSTRMTSQTSDGVQWGKFENIVSMWYVLLYKLN